MWHNNHTQTLFPFLLTTNFVDTFAVLQTKVLVCFMSMFWQSYARV